MFGYFVLTELKYRYDNYGLTGYFGEQIGLYCGDAMSPNTPMMKCWSIIGNKLEFKEVVMTTDTISSN